MRKLTSILIILLMSFILIGCEEKPDVLPRLSTPYNLSFKDDVLTFNTVLHADGYILNLNGENITLETNEFAFTSSGEYTIQVKAFGEGYRDSLFSTPYHLTITRLKGETRTQYNYSIHSEFDLLVAEYDEMIFGTSLQKIDPINHDGLPHHD